MKKQSNYKKPLKLERFYKSNAWHLARQIVIARDHGLCQNCGGVGTQVHHKIHLTPRNVDDPRIALNEENLVLLCDECHNKVHGRYSKQKFDSDGNLLPN